MEHPMDQGHTVTAQACLDGAERNTMTFPKIVVPGAPGRLLARTAETHVEQFPQ
jgi:hypothetical protein